MDTIYIVSRSRRPLWSAGPCHTGKSGLLCVGCLPRSTNGGTTQTRREQRVCDSFIRVTSLIQLGWSSIPVHCTLKLHTVVPSPPSHTRTIAPRDLISQADLSTSDRNMSESDRQIPTHRVEMLRVAPAGSVISASTTQLARAPSSAVAKLATTTLLLTTSMLSCDGTAAGGSHHVYHGVAPPPTASPSTPLRSHRHQPSAEEVWRQRVGQLRSTLSGSPTGHEVLRAGVAAPARTWAAFRRAVRQDTSVHEGPRECG